MNKAVEKIVISPEGIDVISVKNGINNVTQINLDPQSEEIREILEKYNLSDLKFYPIDLNIVRALAESHDQLVDYLESTRRLSNSKQKVDIPDSTPEIIYDLKELKNSFEYTDNEELKKIKQMELYNQAKRTQAIFKGTKKVELKMGPLDRGYFAVQALLLNRNKGTEIKALNPGILDESRNLRRELYNPELTEKTNDISKNYVMTKEHDNKELQENEETITK